MFVVHGHVARTIVYSLGSITCQSGTRKNGRVLFIALDGVRSWTTFTAYGRVSLWRHSGVARLTLQFSTSYSFYAPAAFKASHRGNHVGILERKAVYFQENWDNVATCW